MTTVRVAADLPGDLADVACKLVFFVSPHITAVRPVAGGAIEVQLDGTSSVQLEVIEKEVLGVTSRLKAGFRPLERRVLFAREPELAPWAGGGRDATERLVRAGWVARHGAGLFGLGPEFVAVMEAIDGAVEGAAREGWGARRRGFPALISAEILRRGGFLTSFPQNASFVSHLPERIDTITAFQQANAASDRVVFPEGGAPTPPTECLPPTVCCHFFHELMGKTLEEGIVVTARGPCFRYEAAQNMPDLTRLWSFQMREVIFAGSDSFVRDQASKGVAILEDLMVRLGLAGSCETASDPFFVNIFGAKRYMQVAGDLKFELRLSLGSEDTVAGASLNRHQDFFGKAFSIGAVDGSPIASGCAGWGLERMALAFLAQHGLEPRRWPDEVARRLREDGAR